MNRGAIATVFSLCHDEFENVSPGAARDQLKLKGMVSNELGHLTDDLLWRSASAGRGRGGGGSIRRAGRQPKEGSSGDD